MSKDRKGNNPEQQNSITILKPEENKFEGRRVIGFSVWIRTEI